MCMLYIESARLRHGHTLPWFLTLLQPQSWFSKSLFPGDEYIAEKALSLQCFKPRQGELCLGWEVSGYGMNRGKGRNVTILWSLYSCYTRAHAPRQSLSSLLLGLEELAWSVSWFLCCWLETREKGGEKGATGVRCWAAAVGPACWWCAQPATTLGLGNAQHQRSRYPRRKRTGTRNPDPGSSASPGLSKSTGPRAVAGSRKRHRVWG